MSSASTRKQRRQPQGERAFGRLSLLELSAARAAAWSVRAVAGDARKFSRPTENENENENESGAASPGRQTAVSSAIDGARPNVGLRCGACEIAVFAALDEQYAHFKSDWHRLNLKRRARGLAALSSEQAEAQLREKEAGKRSKAGADGDDAYDSTSSSSASSSSDDASDAATTSEPVVEFSDGTSVFKVYKTLMADTDTEQFNPYTSLAKLQGSSFRWAVLLLRSGRFAGAIFDKEKAVCHKTFQRYTTRRKQGGAQSASDASGKAKSAGATLRRYNEAALKQDVAALLVEWQRELQDVELIFLSSGKTDRATFFPEKSPVLSSDDPRVRRIPFATFRPTFEEVCRVRSDLCSVRFGPLPPPTSSKSDSAPSKAKESRVLIEAKTAAVVSEEPVEVFMTPRIVEVAKSGSLKELKELLDAEEQVDINAVDEKSMTALHHAAAKGDASAMELLLSRGANPSLLDLHGRPPYFLCNAKETRNVLRRFMAENSEAWDYSTSQIPDGLTSEMEQRKKEKEAEKRRRAKERKKQQKKQAAEEQAREAARKEDEERKIAAGLACDFCGKYAGKSPFTRLEFKYCSTDCVNAHKRKLMSEAALRRLGG